WFGSCPSCGASGTLTETVTERGFVRAGKAAADAVSLSEVTTRDLARIPSGIEELDRAPGGGLVAGQVALLGGDPGIGKSTILLEVLPGGSAGAPPLYLSRDESDG